MLRTMLGAMACVVALLTGLQVAGATPADTPFRPVAVVNDSAITGFDLAQRAQIMSALGFPAASPEALRAAALDRLIQDRLKLQEAKRAGLTATPEAIKAGIDEFAANAKMAPDELRALMSAHGVTEQALSDLVAAELVWRDLVRGRFGRRADPGEAEIDAEIALIKQRSGVSYRLGEIGLPMTDQGRGEAETRALADRLSASLNQGGDFAAAVKSYSRTPSAGQGGEVGWVLADRLPPEIADALSALSPGQVTRPVEVAGGMTILKLLDKRSEAAAAIDPQNPQLRERIRQQLGDQQTVRLAEGLLQELRRDALIELK